MAAAFIVPFVVYLLGTSFISKFGDEAYPVAYSVVALVVAILLVKLLWGKRAICPHWNIGWGVVFGVVGIVAWILLANLHLEQWLTQYLPAFMQSGERASYNPFEFLGNGVWAWSFIAVRLIGIAVLVPVLEELFWRSFLLRWIIDPDWEKVPIGEFSWQSCAVVTLMFTLAHPEWFAAATWCLLINALLYWKKDIWLCIVAHATSNLALAIYVLVTGEWWLW